MDFHIDIDRWADIIHRFPVLLVIGVGLLAGVGLTQIAKQGYLAFAVKRMSLARYRFCVNTLAAASTAIATYWCWRCVVPLESKGLGHLVAATTGVCAPLVYKGVKAIVAVKWPDFAAKWGDGSASQQEGNPQ